MQFPKVLPIASGWRPCLRFSEMVGVLFIRALGAAHPISAARRIMFDAREPGYDTKAPEKIGIGQYSQPAASRVRLGSDIAIFSHHMPNNWIVVAGPTQSGAPRATPFLASHCGRPRRVILCAPTWCRWLFAVPLHLGVRPWYRPLTL